MAQEIADSKLIDTWSSDGLKVKPDISKIIEGWQLGEQPPHEYMNWLQNTFGSKLNHILKNGVANWNNTTQYLAGSSVQHNGNVWLCKTTNTNSTPTDVNANWKRIITIEALATLLDGYVKNTGDQDIDGIKNFLKSPIVPTPTSGTQAANKNYVDSAATLNINALTNKTTPVDADLIPLSDSAATFGIKKLTWANIKATLISSFGVMISTLTEKATPVDADIFTIGDSASTNASKKLTWANLKATLDSTWVANDSRTMTALNATGTAPIYACRAWVNFNGTGTVAIRASGNVSSVADNGVGDYTINQSVTQPNANYAVGGISTEQSGGARNIQLHSTATGGAPTLKTTMQTRIMYNGIGGLLDSQNISVFILG